MKPETRDAGHYIICLQEKCAVANAPFGRLLFDTGSTIEHVEFPRESRADQSDKVNQCQTLIDKHGPPVGLWVITTGTSHPALFEDFAKVDGLRKRLADYENREHQRG
jgi:hypothetical protein